MSKIYNLILAFLLITSVVVAQNYTIKGKVADARNGEALLGANIYLKGTTFGDASAQGGMYEFTAPRGSYTLVCSYIGYKAVEYAINLTNDMEVNFELDDFEFSLSLEVIADRAKERETPVAFTNIDKQQMEFTLGSRDIPMVLNTTPSVYATEQGGGAGDARVNLRGFDQRNIAIMINGVPINDMENGWVYWSNWDGLSDATSSIQVQRGLSAVNLATPSIGGTMNVISDPTQQRASWFLKTETGTGNFSKQSVFAHTGLVDDKFALSLGLVKKTGDGIAQGTYTDAWSYYLGAAYQINKTNRVELYAMGAPQRHGQRSYKLNAASFSHELARNLGFSEEVLQDPLFQELGLNYNPNFGGAPSEYDGKQYYEMYWNTPITERYNPSYMWERENYYHKPLVNLNWYTQFSEKFSLYTTAYWSGGKGGGTGTYGSMVWDYTNKQRVANWAGTITRNIGNTRDLDLYGTGDTTTYRVSRGILRNSVNQQWTIGAISKAYYKVNQDLTLSFGVDWRHAEIGHWREVRDLLGGDIYQEFAGNNQFITNPMDLYVRLGDKINYDNTNTVDWIGGYVQGEYTADRLTVYGTAGYSMIKYDYEDRFRTAAKLPNGDPDPSSGIRVIETDWIGGYQFKGGASFRVTAETDVYANFGYVSKVPIFDQVIDDVNGVQLEDPKNEKFLSAELGANFRLMKNMLNIKSNVYYTNWTDRAQSRGVQNADGSEGLVRLDGIESSHMGIEAEIAFQPVKYFRLDFAGSKAVWEYGADVSGTYIPDAGDPTSAVDYNYYIDGLKVGDAPQFQLSAGLTLFPFNGFQAQLVWQFNDDYYSAYDPFSRNDPDDRAQVWQIPSFHLFNLHVSYRLPLSGADITVFGHVFNLFDELYVADATDNSSFNAYTGNGMNHSADDAEIFPGLPRNFKAGFSIRF
ncbi:tonb-dependent receptor [hydrocarbon metagenome]|uniref:Tonb-dependent receptor n=1 Tax=hydrocarbon metagenome TaxID=938273 RepID=A0A0W8FWJ5_9ZZZZ